MPVNKFITFEGGEGSGKSTQIELLAKYLRGQGHEVVTTREPGGTSHAEEIRAILVDGAVNKWDGFSEVLLNFAARNEHVKKVIRPALDAGKWVLCDRFYDSTIVYQGYGQGQDIDKINQIRLLTLDGFVPDKTFLLDIDVEAALQRAEQRGDTNRYEKMGVEFHKKIRAGFLKQAAENKDRFVVVDAAQSVDAVHAQIVRGV